MIFAKIAPSAHKAAFLNAGPPRHQHPDICFDCSTRYTRGDLAGLIKPYHAGRLVNQLKELAVMVDPLPHVERSPDPNDDFLLEAAEASRVDFLVTGDKSGLLALKIHRGTKIVTARDFAARII